MTFFEDLYSTFIETNGYLSLLKGLLNTVLITVGAVVIGIVIGSAIAVAKYFSEDNPKLKVLNFICDAYTTIIRGIPVTVLLLLFFFGIFAFARNGFWIAVLVFGINSGAYMAELIRSGINAVDKGQMEAARSLGMSKWQAMRSIILPQATKNILPAIGNEFIALLKETSVAGFVSVEELTFKAGLLVNNTGEAILPYIALAIFYLILVIGLSKLLTLLERRLKKSERRVNK